MDFRPAETEWETRVTIILDNAFQPSGKLRRGLLERFASMCSFRFATPAALTLPEF